MDTKQNFIEKLTAEYTFKGASLVVGGAMLNGECIAGETVKIPLKATKSTWFNRRSYRNRQNKNNSKSG